MEATETKQIAVIEFNEAQKAAMAAALMAVADEIVEPSRKVKKEKKKKPPLRAGDIIELSDSDESSDGSSSDCEITGFVTLDTNQPVSEDVQFYPPVVKVEVKEELVQLLYPEEQPAPPAAEPLDNSMIINDAEEQAEPSPETAAEEKQMPQPLQFWQKEEQPLDMVEEVAVTTTTSRPVIITNVLTLAPPMLTTFLDKNYGETLLEPLDDTRTPNTAHAENGKGGNYADNTDSASEASSGELFIDETTDLAAATFGADQFALEADQAQILDEDESMDNVMDDDIIELGDSDDENDHMDEETEKKLIDLIASDSEEEETTSVCSQPPERSLANLIHYMCPECGLSCGSMRKWRGHLESEHSFGELSKLNMQTIVNKEGDLCHQCKTCQRKFPRNAYFSMLLQHALSHLPFNDYFKCRLCDVRCTKRAHLRKHLVRDHNKICKHYVGQRRNTNMRHVRFYCPVCGQHQKSEKRWKKHLEEEHDYLAAVEEKTKKSTTSENRWECLTCQKEFCRRQKLYHSFLHEPFKPFRCTVPDCSFECYTISLIRCHIRYKHSTDKILVLCMFCDEKFDTKYLREKHIREKHPRRRLKCHVCLKIFVNPSKLLSHMNASNHQRLK